VNGDRAELWRLRAFAALAVPLLKRLAAFRWARCAVEAREALAVLSDGD
jgi:hypothetical protein